MGRAIQFGLPLLVVLVSASGARAQHSTWDTAVDTPRPGQVYPTSGAEWQFSVPVLDVAGNDRGAVVRFTPFVNMQGLVHFDTSERFGIFMGLSLRNHGFIYADPTSDLRYKFRTYNAGLPIGIKFGRMHNVLLYGGYLMELPFHYQEKRFLNEKRDDRFGVWLSGRNEPLHHGVFIGLQSTRSVNFTLRYQLNNFHAKDFTETVDGVEIRPYAALDARVITFAIGFGLYNGERIITTPRAPATREVHAGR